jgi:hypothetical protein
LALAALPAFSGLAAVSVVDERPGHLSVEVRFDATATGRSVRWSTLGVLNEPGLPKIRYERFFVAAPREARIAARLDDAVGEDRAGRLPELGAPRRLPADPGREERAVGAAKGLLPEAPFRVSGPLTFRGTTVFAVDCFASQVNYAAGTQKVWSRYRIRIDVGAGADHVPVQLVDPLVRDFVVNRNTVPVPKRARVALSTPVAATPVPDPHFSLSSNWVRVAVNAAGLYVIEGADLARIGVDLASIDDPSSFRLFTGGGEQQAVDLRAANGSYLPGDWMNECDILVEDGGDMSFDPADRVVFYGLGTPGWADLYRPGAPRHEFTDHLYASQNAYFLTWDDVPGFPGAPARMSAAPAAPSAGPDVITFEERLYFEIDRAENLTFGGDGWLWIDVVAGTGAQTFLVTENLVVNNLDPSAPQTFRTVALAKEGPNDNSNLGHHALYLMNNVLFAEQVWDGVPLSRYENGVPVVATGYFLNEGTNRLDLSVPRDLNAQDFMYFAWFGVFYSRFLRAQNNALLFSSPDTTATVSYSVGGFGSAGGALRLFDVTDPYHPAELTGFSETLVGGERSIRFSSGVAGLRRYYAALTSGALATRKPFAVVRHFPRDLRSATTSPHMVIIAPPPFSSAAQVLRQHRETILPYYSNPRVEAVTTTEVFDNFSGGLPDGMAIRNYCKYLYDNYTEPGGAPSLTYLLLLGDANSDFKSIVNPQPNLVATHVNMNPVELEGYASDDYFAYLDSADTSGSSFLDVAVGRLPAASLQEASLLVDRVIDYELSADFAPWRDRVMLVADDEGPPEGFQDDFIFHSEAMAHDWIRPYVEAHKTYLTEFPLVGDVKPSSRVSFVSDWNRGALVISYVGHGSSVGLADEQVFLDSDVGSLRNGLRLPLFMAMSCTVGDFAEAAKSLSERLVLKDGGGAIAALAASELTFISQNDDLQITLVRALFSPVPGAPAPLGVAVMNAKNTSLSMNPFPGSQENNEKYNLIGDPALRLHVPRRSIALDSTDVDTLVAGKRETVRGTVYANGSPDSSFFGTVYLTVRESDDESGYTRPSDGYQINYRYAGGTMYEGTADVTAGRFEFSFRAPRFGRFGDKAFVLAYAENDQIDAIAKNDRVVLRAPAPIDSTDLIPVDGSPRVNLGFEGGGDIVKPGAVLVASARDGDGINVLNTTPEGKIALVFDRASLALDVTGFFEFDHGGIDTSGTVRFPIPDLSAGPHRAVFKLADAFGQVTVDTLDFTLADPQDYGAQVVLNYPNPFQASTYFMMTLTDRADIHFDIFTVSGKKIRSLRETKDAGEQWILWDGRDETGDTIANGTYLYVARVTFAGLDRTPLVLRGKLVKVE